MDLEQRVKDLETIVSSSYVLVTADGYGEIDNAIRRLSQQRSVKQLTQVGTPKDETNAQAIGKIIDRNDFELSYRCDCGKRTQRHTHEEPTEEQAWSWVCECGRHTTISIFATFPAKTEPIGKDRNGTPFYSGDILGCEGFIYQYTAKHSDENYEDNVVTKSPDGIEWSLIMSKCYLIQAGPNNPNYKAVEK